MPLHAGREDAAHAALGVEPRLLLDLAHRARGLVAGLALDLVAGAPAGPASRSCPDALQLVQPRLARSRVQPRPSARCTRCSSCAPSARVRARRARQAAPRATPRAAGSAPPGGTISARRSPSSVSRRSRSSASSSRHPSVAADRRHGGPGFVSTSGASEAAAARRPAHLLPAVNRAGAAANDPCCRQQGPLQLQSRSTDPSGTLLSGHPAAAACTSAAGGIPASRMEQAEAVPEL